MNKIICSLFFLTIISCSPENCSNLYFDKKNKLTYFNDELYTGLCESYYFTGEIKSIQKYNNGKEHGDWLFFYNNKNIQVSGSFSNGNRIGEWKYFFENGLIWKENFYDSLGKKIGVWKEYDEEGGIINKIIISKN